MIYTLNLFAQKVINFVLFPDRKQAYDMMACHTIISWAMISCFYFKGP